MESGCRTILFSTHDVDLALEWADRAVVMVDGQIRADGLPIEILSDDALMKDAGLRKPAVLTLCDELDIAPCHCVEDLVERLEQEKRCRPPGI
jgi:energy-coupling factor transporter ATP-binding protein EcfA2